MSVDGGGGPIVTLMNMMATSAQYHYTSIGGQGTGHTAPCQNGRAWFSKFHCSYNATIIAAHALFSGAGAGTAQARLIVADDSAGVPNNVLGTTALQTIGTATQLDFPMNLSVVSGDLHLGCVTGAGGYPTLVGSYVVGQVQERKEGFSATSPPTVVGTLDSSDAGEQISVWVDLKF